MYGLGLYSKWELKINSWDVHTLALLWKVIAVGCQRFCEWDWLGLVREKETNTFDFDIVSTMAAYYVLILRFWALWFTGNCQSLTNPNL